MRSTGLSKKKSKRDSTFLQRRSHPPTLLPCDHLVTAFCVWEWGNPKLRWAYHGDNQPTQYISRDGKYFLHFMCQQHEQLDKNLVECVRGGILTLDQAGKKGVNMSKWVKWMHITLTTRNSVRLRHLQSIQHQDLGTFPKKCMPKSMPKDCTYQFRYKVKNPGRWLLDQGQPDVKKF